MQDFSAFSQVDFYLQLSPFLVYYCEFIYLWQKKEYKYDFTVQI